MQGSIFMRDAPTFQLQNSAPSNVGTRITTVISNQVFMAKEYISKL